MRAISTGCVGKAVDEVHQPFDCIEEDLRVRMIQCPFEGGHHPIEDHVIGENPFAKPLVKRRFRDCGIERVFVS
jgi:hypothetical protein